MCAEPPRGPGRCRCSDRAGPSTSSFPIEGWTFPAAFAEPRDHPLDDGDHPTDAEQPEPGRFSVTPPGPGDFRVDLRGTGPQGDYWASFRWPIVREGSPARARTPSVAGW